MTLRAALIAAVTATSDASQRPLWQRLALGVLCGASAAVLGYFHISVPILSPETPEFTFGGVFVLFAFRTLGPGPGLIAALLGFGYGSPSGITEVMLVTTTLYAAEGYVASRLAVRTRSLVVANVVFWLTGGALLDAIAYIGLIGLAPGYVALLLVKQLLNGVINSVIAEAVARRRAMRNWLRIPPQPARSWQQVLFDRSVPLVMIPMTVIVLLLARASHAAALNQMSVDLRRAATNAEKAADRFLTTRLASLEQLRDQLRGAPLGQTAVTESLLIAWLASHREFVNVFTTDDAGIVTAAAPTGSITGAPLRGRDLSRRPYFAAVRDQRQTVFGELVLGQLRIRRTGIEPILPLAMPLPAPGGRFNGILIGAMDATQLGAILTSRLTNEGGLAQLLDKYGRVVASSSSEWMPGQQRGAAYAAVSADTSSEARVLQQSASDSYEARLGVSPRLTITQRVANHPFVVLVDEPLSMLHEALIPTSLGLIALMLLALLAVFAVARSLGDQLSSPLQSIGAVAEDLAGGQPVPHEVLDHFGASGVLEIRALATQLLRMDDALRARREADAQAVHQSETKYRETLEQLAQAQKMEGIGRLAGGIAHDFNNLLTPIVGYTDLALSSLPANTPARKDLALVRTAAGRAKEVVAQLLAFGRAQVLDTKRIDLAEVVAEFEPLLRRSLAVDYDLVVIAEPGVVVEADRAKVQQVLMNLVLNAADAMPKGGRVEVRVGTIQDVACDPSDPEPIAAGSYGVVRVRDHGVGMDDATRRRAFDPFFTTKPRGKGTGLGLSTAYGISRQHRGTIQVESAPGNGTEMRVLLPLAAPAPHLVPTGLATPDLPLPAASLATDSGAQTILVAEDEPTVRELVRSALARAGYRVLAARDGEEAMVRAAAHDGRIDLLLTDVVMPNVNGRELARRFRAARPDARVLFMSGYAADVIADEGALNGDAELLVKPFTPEELEARVRAALGL